MEIISSTPAAVADQTPIRNREFAINGINHVAMVCSDMDATMAFYTEVLGMPFLKEITLPDGVSKHFFFGLGNGDSLAFFYFPDAPPASPGIAAPSGVPGTPGLTSGIGSMNHLAFNVAEDRMEEYRRRLREKGVQVTPIANHDDSPQQHSPTMYDGVFMRSMYFFDPDGILLEFACWSNAAQSLADRQQPDVEGV